MWSAQHCGLNVSQLNSLPKFTSPLQINGITSKDWYFFFSGLYTGLAPSQPSSISVGVSPFTYSAVVKGSIIVQGGTVSSIQFSRNGVTFYNVGQTSGMIPINAADRIIVTYTVKPAMTFVPS